MSNLTRKTYTLGGLGCAHCAEKIQQGLSQLDSETRFLLNFSTGTLLVETGSPENIPALMHRAQKLISGIEPGVTLRPQQTENLQETKDFPLFEIRLGTALLFFAFALFFPMVPFVKTALLLAAYLIAGADVLWKAVRNLAKGHMLDEHFLMSIATLGALGINQPSEAAAVMLFFQVGELFQGLAVQKSRRSVKALLNMKVEETRVLESGIEILRATEMVYSGSLIVVRPGERIPLDGLVEEGLSTLDTSALTGESLPRAVMPGDEVLSGSINLNALMKIRTTKPYADSTVAKILHLVENASSRKSPTEQFITRFARFYTPAVVAASVSIALIPPMVMGFEDWSLWFYRALVFLVISCPCALVISIPLGFFGGIGAASRAGILVKGSNYLEALTDVDTVVFDKTGTLTEGRFSINNIIPSGRFSEKGLLELAAYAESGSTHPIARSVMDAWNSSIDPNRITGLEEIHGMGIHGMFDGKPVMAGRKSHLANVGIQGIPDSDPGTSIYIAYEGRYAGSITFKDRLKRGTADAMKQLLSNGVKHLVLLSGDNREAVRSAAAEAGITEVHAELLPQDKVTMVEELINALPKGRKLIFVGDGINDAPVLARADIGIAMGGVGSDAAVEAADVVLMTDEPGKVVEAIRIARFTRRVVIQNIALAFAVKGLVLLLGAAGLATLWEAVFADVGVAVLAILNAMRVLKSGSVERQALSVKR